MRVGIAADHGGFDLKEELVGPPKLSGQGATRRGAVMFSL
jgi:hypothetical protein